MKTPVIIAARNEQLHIATTLASLPAESRPIVVANGSSDKTAKIANSFGVELIELKEPSKVRALQAGIEQIGKVVTQGFVILDADTRPVFPRQWLSSYQKVFNAGEEVVCGPLFYGPDKGRLVGLARSVKSYSRNLNNLRTGNDDYVHGANMGIRTNIEVIEEILHLPNIWPCEDMALRDLVIEHGGDFSIRPSLLMAVVSSARGYQGLGERLRSGRTNSERHTRDWYNSSAPEERVSYENWRSSR